DGIELGLVGLVQFYSLAGPLASSRSCAPLEIAKLKAYIRGSRTGMILVPTLRVGTASRPLRGHVLG
ncbi:MAG TPA: hypothetical protein VGX76_06045, partial [Pirellulales bacterium]|nr:hypothetical protein [Pirellulales bacterium]